MNGRPVTTRGAPRWVKVFGAVAVVVVVLVVIAHLTGLAPAGMH
jgi:hypothetical protein